MWTREEIKSKAKRVLAGSYWKAFLVSLVIAVVGGSGGSSGGGSSSFRNSGDQTSAGILAGIIVLLVVVGFIALAIRIFLGYALEIGGRKYFIRASEEDVNLSYLGYAFKMNAYGKIILTMLYRAVLIFLWTLLLIIPGIIKSYAYRMVPYILADNPEIGVTRAIELSNAMTKGEKLNIWVLDLSFIGWYLLGMLALFVGVLFVKPYEDTTNAELYLVLRQQALDNGNCTYEELNLSAPLTISN